jgi:hypothetical protein
MAITPDDLNQAGEVVRAASTLREAAAIWRARDPDMRVLVVDAMDMRDETPVLTLGARSVYLGASNGHCWRVTGQPAEATALILTEG